MRPGEPLVYASFWRRLGALLVDLAVVAPFVALDLWLDRLSRTYSLASLLPLFLLASAYTIYFHARWGQTLGKMAAGIKVVSLDGSNISLRQAFLRDSVTLALGFVHLFIYAGAISSITPGDYRELSFTARSQRVNDFTRQWRYFYWLSDAWTWSEVIVILFNKKRRAPHDFSTLR